MLLLLLLSRAGRLGQDDVLHQSTHCSCAGGVRVSVIVFEARSDG